MYVGLKHMYSILGAKKFLHVKMSHLNLLFRLSYRKRLLISTRFLYACTPHKSEIHA